MDQLNFFNIPLFDVRTCAVEELFKFKLNKIYEFLNEEEKDIFCQRVCDYYHNVVGFPYYGEEVNLTKELERFKNYDPTRLLLEENELQQVMFGLSICNFFHPHMWDVKCRNQKTPKEVFLDKDFMKSYLLKNGVTETLDPDVLLEIKSGQVKCIIKTSYSDFSNQLENVKLALKNYHYTVKII